MKFTVQATLPGSHRNSPRADTLCSDLAGLTQLPAALFVADEAAITVSLDADQGADGHGVVRALIGVGADDEFDSSIRLIGAVPTLGLIDVPHIVDLTGTVEKAITKCATAFALALSEALEASDAHRPAELVVLDHRGDTHIAASF